MSHLSVPRVPMVCLVVFFMEEIFHELLFLSSSEQEWVCLPRSEVFHTLCASDSFACFYPFLRCCAFQILIVFVSRREEMARKRIINGSDDEAENEYSMKRKKDIDEKIRELNKEIQEVESGIFPPTELYDPRGSQGHQEAGWIADEREGGQEIDCCKWISVEKRGRREHVQLSSACCRPNLCCMLFYEKRRDELQSIEWFGGRKEEIDRRIEEPNSPDWGGLFWYLAIEMDCNGHRNTH